MQISFKPHGLDFAGLLGVFLGYRHLNFIQNANCVTTFAGLRTRLYSSRNSDSPIIQIYTGSISNLQASPRRIIVFQEYLQLVTLPTHTAKSAS